MDKIASIYKRTVTSGLIFLLLLHSPFVSCQSDQTIMPIEPSQALIDAFQAKDEDYQPRTHHLVDGQPKYINRLIMQDSPYLLQHAHNPVNWYPWGEEAFKTAKEENKPIFLSIGYATCHWCHVMEAESFESEEIAEILNKHFISIKVDREQHPDVDDTYMMAVMIMTGQGGWPMSSFLLPDGQPFFGGTYFPPARFSDLLLRVAHLWEEQNDQIVAQAKELANAVRQSGQSQSDVDHIAAHAPATATADLLGRYDEIYGGFGSAPKFPNEPSLSLLLQMALRQPDNQALQTAITHTLTVMANGGIYDQVGGGFHRYATDDRWLVPHFEKMLYNQAYLSRLYCQAGLQFNKPLFLRTCRQTLDYVLREMTREDGGFYSATDADSEGEEGLFFVWTPHQIDAELKLDDAAWIKDFYKVTSSGNFEGKTIFALDRPLDEIARVRNIPLADLITRLDKVHEKLYTSRLKRIPPLTDDKIIVAWNGMMITAFAELGHKLNEPKYIDAAKRAADLIWSSQRDQDGKLLRVNLDQKASITAKQDDYAHYAEALIALYDATQDKSWLNKAREITDEMIEQLYDQNTGRFVLSRDQLLFTQAASNHDSATPSSNAVAVRVINQLWRRTGERNYLDLANKTITAFAGEIDQYPGSYAYLLAEVDSLRNGETDDPVYLANGAVRVTTDHQKDQADQYVNISISITPGWHINSSEPNQPDLIPTKLRSADTDSSLEDLNYPKGKNKQLEFDPKPLSLYEDQITISARVKGTDNLPLELELDIQACNEEACLPPETAKLIVLPAQAK